MSSYIEFYIKAGATYAPIASNSRSSHIYQAFQYKVPYEEARALTKADLDEVRNDMNLERTRMEKELTALNEKLEWLKSSNLPIDERMQAYDDAREMIDYYKEEIDAVGRVIDFCIFLDDILDEIRYLPDTAAKLEVDADHYIYCGIDCGNPGFKDLEE